MPVPDYKMRENKDLDLDKFRSKNGTKQIYQINQIRRNSRITHIEKFWLQLVTIFKIEKLYQKSLNKAPKNDLKRSTKLPDLEGEESVRGEGVFSRKIQIVIDSWIRNYSNKIKLVAKLLKSQFLKIQTFVYCMVNETENNSKIKRGNFDE